MLKLDELLIEGILLNSIHLRLQRYFYDWQPDEEVLDLVNAELERISAKEFTMAHELYLQDLIDILEREIEDYNLLRKSGSYSFITLNQLYLKIAWKFSLATGSQMDVLKQIIVQKKFKYPSEPFIS